MTPAPSPITFMAMPLDGSGTADRTQGPAAAPSVHEPERFRNALVALRCSFGGPTPAGQITLQTANYAVAVPEPERLWEISPSVGLLEPALLQRGDFKSPLAARAMWLGGDRGVGAYDTS